MLRTATERKWRTIAILLPIEAVREIVLKSALGKLEQICGRGILDVAPTPTRVNFNLGTGKAHVTVNALVVVDVSDVLHGSPL